MIVKELLEALFAIMENDVKGVRVSEGLVGDRSRHELRLRRVR